MSETITATALDPDTVVTVTVPAPPPVVAVQLQLAPEVIVVDVGRRGETGPPGGSALILVQETPAGTWSFTHNLGRLPMVAIYVEGELVFAPVDATDHSIAVEFPSPVVGTLVLT